MFNHCCLSLLYSGQLIIYPQNAITEQLSERFSVCYFISTNIKYVDKTYVTVHCNYHISIHIIKIICKLQNTRQNFKIPSPSCY